MDLKRSGHDRLFTAAKLDAGWIDAAIPASVGVSGLVGGAGCLSPA